MFRLVARLILLIATLNLFVACSSRDKDVENIPAYRDVSAQCANIGLSGERLGPQSARSLVGCLNSEGALQPIANLLNRASDQELAGLLRWSSAEFVENRRRLNQVDQTVQLMRSSGELKTVLETVGELMSDERLIEGALGSLRTAYRNPATRAEILIALEVIASRLSPDRVMHAWDEVSMLASIESARELRSRLSGIGENRELSERYGRAFHSLLRSGRSGESRTGADPIEGLVQKTVNGEVLPLWDEWIGRDSQAVRSRVPEVAASLSLLAKDNARLGESLFKFLQGVRGEVKCLAGTHLTPDGTRYVLQSVATRKNPDLRSFAKRDARIDHAIQSSFCEIPPAVERYYSDLVAVAESGAAPAFDRLTKTSVNLGLDQWLADLLSMGLREGAGGLLHLLPVLVDWESRDLAPDLLLYLQSLSDKSRAAFLSSFEIYVKPDPRLSGKSPLAVFMDAAAQADSPEVAKLLGGLLRLLDPKLTLKNGLLLTERLKIAAEKGFTASDAHPWIDALQQTAAHATKNADLFESLFELSQYPEFGRATVFIGKMARDGSLDELMASVLKLFQSMSQEGFERNLAPRARTQAVAFEFRHDFSSKDLARLSFAPPLPRLGDPCAGVRFSVPLQELSNPSYDTQIEAILACAGVKPELESTIRLVRELREAPGRDGQTIWNHAVRLTTDLLRFSSSTIQSLMGRLFSAYDDGRVSRVMSALPLISDPVKALSPAVTMMFEKAREQVRVLLVFLSDIITLKDLPQALSFSQKLDPSKNLPDPFIPDVSDDASFRDQVRRALRAHECLQDPAEIELRTQAIFDEYKGAANNWELVGGRPRARWELSELKAGLSPLLQKTKRPETDGSVVDGVFRFFSFFSLESQGVAYEDRISHYPRSRKQGAHYHPEYLGRWLSERAHDPRLILYFYPDQSQPRVRIVNTLDRLELLLYNADFDDAVNPVSIRQENIGLMALASIAEAWGDEPRWMWPAEIRQKYRGRAPTLSDSYDYILNVLRQSENFLKYPPYRDCPGEKPVISVPRTGSDWIPGPIQVPLPMDWRRRMFNLRQVITVMHEELPGRGEGMRLLRDLFFTIHMTTPESARTPRAGRRNNLVVVGDLVKTGLIRQLGRRMMLMPEIPGEQSRWSEPAYRARAGAMLDFYAGFVRAAQTPSAESILEKLLVEDRDQRVLWNAIEAIFKVVDRHPEEVGPLREAALYALASTNWMRVAPQAARALEEVIRAEQGLLSRSSDRIYDLLKDPHELPKWLRAVYETPDSEGKRALAAVVYFALSREGVPTALVRTLEAVDGDPRARDSLEEFDRRFSRVRQDPAYTSLRVGELLDDALTVMADTPELRQSIATSVRSPDFEGLLEGLARDPERLSRVIDVISFHASRGDLIEPIEMARKYLVPNAKLRDNRSHVLKR